MHMHAFQFDKSMSDDEANLAADDDENGDRHRGRNVPRRLLSFLCSWFKQLGWMLWKNLHVRRRSPVYLTLEIVVPTLLPILTMALKYNERLAYDSTVYESFNLTSLPATIINASNQTLAYVPNDSPLVDAIMLSVHARLNFPIKGRRR